MPTGTLGADCDEVLTIVLRFSGGHYPSLNLFELAWNLGGQQLVTVIGDQNFILDTYAETTLGQIDTWLHGNDRS